MVISYRYYLAVLSIASNLSCSSPQSPRKGPEAHVKFRLIDGRGNEVNMREEKLKILPNDATLSPIFLNAILFVLNHRHTTQFALLNPIERERDNYYYEAKTARDGVVEVTLIPVPPVGWGFEWTESGKSHRGAWYEVDLARAKIVGFAFCHLIKNSKCPPESGRVRGAVQVD